jgi:hypothetical protein
MKLHTNERNYAFKIQQFEQELADESLNLKALQGALQHNRAGQGLAQIAATRYQIKRIEVLLIEKKDALAALKQVQEDEYGTDNWN